MNPFSVSSTDCFRNSFPRFFWEFSNGFFKKTINFLNNAPFQKPSGNLREITPRILLEDFPRISSKIPASTSSDNLPGIAYENFPRISLEIQIFWNFYKDGFGKSYMDSFCNPFRKSKIYPNFITRENQRIFQELPQESLIVVLGLLKKNFWDWSIFLKNFPQKSSWICS